MVGLVRHTALMLTVSMVVASCSRPPVVVTPLPTHTATATETPARGTATATLAPSNTPGNETATLTPRPTSDSPDVPPGIIAPEDGAIINGTFPDFQFTWPPRAWTVNIVIFNVDGYWEEYIFGGGAGMSGWMNDMFTPVSPSLPPGTYQWYAFGCRQTAVGGCGPGSGTWTFTILG
jgi:hypothetical protein